METIFFLSRLHSRVTLVSIPPFTDVNFTTSPRKKTQTNILYRLIVIQCDEMPNSRRLINEINATRRHRGVKHSSRVCWRASEVITPGGCNVGRTIILAAALYSRTFLRHRPRNAYIFIFLRLLQRPAGNSCPPALSSLFSFIASSNSHFSRATGENRPRRANIAL